MKMEGQSRFLDEATRRRHKRRNLVQSVILLLALAGLLALSGLLLLGPEAGLWAAAGWAIAMLFAPGVEPAVALSLMGARPLSPRSFPAGHAVVGTLAAKAGLRSPPDIYYLPSRQLNAFTLGRGGKSAVAVTDGLLRHLDRREFAAVMAHEIGHLLNNDLWLINLGDSMSRMTRAIGFVGILLLLLGLPLLLSGAAGPTWLLGAVLLTLAPSAAALLQLALSRTREFDADLEAVGLTGDPVGLISALSKLESRQGGLWQLLTGRGRTDAPSLLRSHPATAERIERLRELQPSSAGPAAWSENWGRGDLPKPR